MFRLTEIFDSPIQSLGDISLMARQKRGSRTLEKAERRFSSIQQIDSKIVLDGGVSATNYNKNITDLRNKISTYNTTLSTVDDLYIEIIDAERALADYSEKVLLGVAARFGKDSKEYEVAGGIRKRSRKRPTRTSAAATS